MNPFERQILYLANLLVVGTGVVYAAIRYLMKPADEWAVINHPWQPHVPHQHILVASGAWHFAMLGHAIQPFLLKVKSLVSTPVSAARITNTDYQEG